MHSYNIDSVTSEEAEILNEKMDAFNAHELSFSGKVEEFATYVIKDQGTIIAGIKTCLYLKECMFVSLLFVDEAYRGKGLGSRLLQYAEQKAVSKKMRLAHLDTFDFQAKDFYLKQGYEIFGVLEDCPKGHKRYFLKKILST